MSTTEKILGILNEQLGGEQIELADHVHQLFGEHPNYQEDASEREQLRKKIQKLLRPSTHSLRVLMNCPNLLVNSVQTRPPHRLDLLEILPTTTNGEAHVGRPN